MGWLKKSYWGVVKSEHFVGHLLLLLIRVYWGALLVVTGIGKLSNVSGVSEFFTSLNIPAPLLMTYIVAIVELLGGISLFFGFFTRIMTIPLVVVFIVAYTTAHTEALLGFFIAPSVFVAQEPFLYLYASLIVLSFGSGLFSLDYWLEKQGFHTELRF